MSKIYGITSNAYKCLGAVVFGAVGYNVSAYVSSIYNGEKHFFDTTTNTLYLNDMGNFLNDEIINKMKLDANLTIVINSNGGLLDTAKQLQMLTGTIKNIYKKEVIVYVPKKALSAGCIAALTGTKLYANGSAQFSQIDPQYSGAIVDSIFHPRIAFRYIKEHGMGNWTKGFAIDAINETEDIMNKILIGRYNYFERFAIKRDLLTNPKFTHEFKYSVPDMKKIGVKFDGECPKEISDSVENNLTNLIKRFKMLTS